MTLREGSDERSNRCLQRHENACFEMDGVVGMEACNNERRSAEEWALCATVCEFVALSLRYPTDELAAAVYSGEWLAALYEMAAQRKLTLPVWLSEQENSVTCVSSLSDGSPSQSAHLLAKALRVESTRLFMGVAEPVVSPYEGMWRTAESGSEGLMFVNRYSIEVRRFFGACGLGRSTQANDPLDHVATEFELLEYLAAHASDPIESASLHPADAWPGGSPSEAYWLFLADHMGRWTPCFFKRVIEMTNLPFYRAIAAFAQAFVEFELGELEQLARQREQVSTPSSGVETKNGNGSDPG